MADINHTKITYTSTGLKDIIKFFPKSDQVVFSIKASDNALFHIHYKIHEASELIKPLSTSNLKGDQGQASLLWGSMKFFALDIDNLGTSGQIILDYILK